MRATRLLLVLAFMPRLVVAQGNPLGPEFRVNTYTTNDQRQPAVAADSAGNFVVVWPTGSADKHIHAQRYASSGAPLGAEVSVDEFPFGGVTTVPSVAADSAGNFVVIWQFAAMPGDPSGLLGRLFASSGTPLGGQFFVGSTAYNYNPAVARDPGGNFVVVWENVIPGDGAASIGVFGQRYAGSGSPLGSPFRVNTYTTGHQAVASVAVDPSGDFVVVWNSEAQDGSGFGVYGQRFASSGAPIGSEFRVNTFTANGQSSPAVGADSSGNFVVVWQSAQQDGSGAGIFGQRYASSGAPLGPEFLVNTFTTGDETAPSVTADASGNFVVVWQSALEDGVGNGIFGQRFAGSGEPLGSEFRINTYVTNDQSGPAVAADPLGSFVVVWESNLQDGSGEGVFGQRWRPMLPVELLKLGVE